MYEIGLAEERDPGKMDLVTKQAAIQQQLMANGGKQDAEMFTEHMRRRGEDDYIEVDSDGEVDVEVEKLLNWSENLDFEGYAEVRLSKERSDELKAVARGMNAACVRTLIRDVAPPSPSPRFSLLILTLFAIRSAHRRTGLPSEHQERRRSGERWKTQWKAKCRNRKDQKQDC